MDSKLQIISGRFHGRRLYLPPNARPTQNRARAALFNMLASGLVNVGDNLCVWDAFAGSGAFGIEFLSRYPNSRVIFTDIDPESVRTVQKNLSLLNIGTAASVVQSDAVIAADKYAQSADVIFVDPPYDSAVKGAEFVNRVASRIKDGAILIWEQELSQSVMPPVEWRILRDKTYGRARFFVLTRGDE